MGLSYSKYWLKHTYVIFSYAVKEILFHVQCRSKNMPTTFVWTGLSLKTKKSGTSNGCTVLCHIGNKYILLRLVPQHTLILSFCMVWGASKFHVFPTRWNDQLNAINFAESITVVLLTDLHTASRHLKNPDSLQMNKCVIILQHSTKFSPRSLRERKKFPMAFK